LFHFKFATKTSQTAVLGSKLNTSGGSTAIDSSCQQPNNLWLTVRCAEYTARI